MYDMETLAGMVAQKAKTYLKDSGEDISAFPSSIADFVIEYAKNNCHFPKHFTEEEIVSVLESRKSSLAMACVDIYAKIGAEGQISHSENGISRGYDSAWITFDLLSNFPNYVSTIW